jgi:hypothetical protein
VALTPQSSSGAELHGVELLYTHVISATLRQALAARRGRFYAAAEYRIDTRAGLDLRTTAALASRHKRARSASETDRSDRRSGR